MANHKSIDSTFGTTVHQLRIAQLVTLGLQVCILMLQIYLLMINFQAITLFMESDRIGLIGFFIPFIVIVGNLFLSGKRWYNEIDGRYDAQQLVNVADPALKAQYALGMFCFDLHSLLF